MTSAPSLKSCRSAAIGTDLNALGQQLANLGFTGDELAALSQARPASRPGWTSWEGSQFGSDVSEVGVVLFQCFNHGIILLS